MKKLLMLMLILTFLLGMTAVAMAGAGSANNYKYTAAFTSGQESGLHGGLGASTDKCRVCHAVHKAGTDGNGANVFKLLRTNGTASAVGACLYCHNSATGLVSDKRVFKNSGGAAEHRVGGNSGATVPDSNSPTWNVTGGTDTGNLDCLDCHRAAPHGKGAQSNDKLTTVTNVATDVTTFCKNCHDKNYQLGWDAKSHIMTVSASGDNRGGRANGPVVGNGTSSAKCTDCHKDKVDGNDFPHSSANGQRFLKTGATSTTLDGVCRDCHGTGGRAVGTNY
jgi:hypothetical protein